MSDPVNLAMFGREMQDKMRRVDFGLQVQAFLKSRIGVFLQKRAESETEEKMQALKVHDVLGDPQGAAILQLEIWRAESFLYWLAEAVTEGSDLMNQMLAEERQALGLDGTGAIDGDPTGS